MDELQKKEMNEDVLALLNKWTVTPKSTIRLVSSLQSASIVHLRELGLSKSDFVESIEKAWDAVEILDAERRAKKEAEKDSNEEEDHD